jgi:hypothetical protein
MPLANFLSGYTGNSLTFAGRDFLFCLLSKSRKIMLQFTSTYQVAEQLLLLELFDNINLPLSFIRAQTRMKQ